MKSKINIQYPIHELIEKRWSPRAFSNKSIDNENVMSLFEAAKWAASGFNSQPWKFLYATKEQPEAFAKLLGCMMDANQIWSKNASLLVLNIVRRTFAGKESENPNALYELGLAVGNLSVQATAMDLYVHQIGGFSAKKAIETFTIPEQYVPSSMLAIGYLGNPETLPNDLKERELAPQERKPLAEIALNLTEYDKSNLK